ncbi:MAG: hypothetical protein ACREQJ_02340, partial [Candidatus Binatia bacterium]
VLASLATSLVAAARARDDKIFLGAAGLSLLAPLANPYGLAGVLYPVRLATVFDYGEWPFTAISELEDPFSAGRFTPELVFYAAFLAIGGLLVASAVALASIHRRSARALVDAEPRGNARLTLIPDAVLFVGLAVLSFSGLRHMALFALGAAPAVARSLASLADAASSRGWRPARSATVVARGLVPAIALVATCLVVTNTLSAWRGTRREFGLGVLEGAFPDRAAAFARQAGLPADGFNDIAAGSYLVWDPVFAAGVHVDGRLEVYGPEFLSSVLAVVLNPRGWHVHADRWGIQTVILSRTQTPLGRSLNRDRRWTLVYFDEASLVFVRRVNEEAIESARGLFPQWKQETEARLRSPVSSWQRPTARVAALSSYADRLVTQGDPDRAAEFYALAASLAERHSIESGARQRLGELERAH